MKRCYTSLFLLLMALFLAIPALAQNLVLINWTAVTGAQSGMFMAHQEGLFKKHGVDVELIHIPSSSRGIQAILAGEISFSFMDAANAGQANMWGVSLSIAAGGATTQYCCALGTQLC